MARSEKPIKREKILRGKCIFSRTALTNGKAAGTAGAAPRFVLVVLILTSTLPPSGHIPEECSTPNQYAITHDIVNAYLPANVQSTSGHRFWRELIAIDDEQIAFRGQQVARKNDQINAFRLRR